MQKYVDCDAVVSELVDTGITGTFGEDDSWLGASAAKLAESAKPALARTVKGALRTGIEMGPDRAGDAAELAGLFAVRSVKSVSYAGEEALVLVEAPYGEERAVEVTLRMKRVDDFWRVIAIEDLPTLEPREDQ
ncbi:hypothetical protein EG835_00135 [bacterium]|nr:hypothetical protein [bacterium]